MNRFKNLSVWQKAMKLAGLIYKLTDCLPEKEKFGLISQLQRNAVSIPSNIAEGAGRNSNKEYRYFLSISQGSIFELETQILICIELKYFNEKVLQEEIKLISEIQRMLYSLQSKLK